MKLFSGKSKGLHGSLRVPGDKSISHRAAMLLPLSHGRGIIRNFLMSEDCLNTLRAMIMAGAKITIENGDIIVDGTGGEGLKNPSSRVYLGNSGTSMRLISGIFCGIKGKTVLYGDDTLNKRPMKRIIEPLRKMGGDIISIQNNDRAPLLIKGGQLNGGDFKLNIASAQVKSAILFGSLLADGHTNISEPEKSRDHTERMLKHLGCSIDVLGKNISMKCGQRLYARDIEVPGDISSAAFLIGGALITPDSDITIKNVLYNETRRGFIDVLKAMGASIEVSDITLINNEEVVDMRVRTSELRGTEIGGELIPRLIDEIPLLAMLAAFAEGSTIISNAEELRHKESNRIKSTIDNLRIAGVDAEETSDGMIIRGGKITREKGLTFDSYHDHRIAMTFSLLGLILDDVRVLNCSNIGTSFPGYVEVMNSIGAHMHILN